MKNKLPSIYDYNDFRRFLQDYQKARVAADSEFSRINICRMLGLPNSRSYFSDVIKGKKVTTTFINRFEKVLGLKHLEAKFFRILVRYNQAESLEDREMYFEQLIMLNKSPKTILAKKAFEYYKDVTHSIVRALLDIYDCRDDFKALGRLAAPQLSAAEVKRSIHLCERLGLIRCNSLGYYKPVAKNLSTGPYENDVIIRHYQLKCLEAAKNALMNTCNQPQTISTKLVSVSAAGYKLIEKRYQAFMAEISSIIHKDCHPADRVYHLDLQLYPASKIINRDKS